MRKGYHANTLEGILPPTKRLTFDDLRRIGVTNIESSPFPQGNFFSYLLFGDYAGVTYMAHGTAKRDPHDQPNRKIARALAEHRAVSDLLAQLVAEEVVSPAQVHALPTCRALAEELREVSEAANG